jgi:hypothetical protein
MKKNTLAIGLVVLVVGFLGVMGIKKIVSLFGGAGDKDSAKNKVAEEVNVIPVAQRPYARIVPLADGHNVTLHVIALNKQAKTVEYELEYQSGSLLQGAFGLIELDKMPAQEQVLLGSCSAGGKCSYHEEVTGGKLLLRFEGDEKYVLRSDWRYVDNADKSTQVASKDSKFQLESDALKTQPYMVVYNSPGYPEGLKRNVVSDHYSLTTSSSLSGKGELTIRATQDLTDSAKIMGYDGQKWHEFAGKVVEKTITAEVELMDLYVVVE